MVIHWLTKILNAIVELEDVPEMLKRGVAVPVYKGEGTEAMKVDRYRGITLTPPCSPLLDCRLHLELEAGLPHVNQSAYIRATLCRCLGVLVEKHQVHCGEHPESIHHIFFHFGRIGVFQGNLSPLSSRSVFESCDADPAVWVQERDYSLLRGLPRGAGEASTEVAKAHF